MSPKSDNPWKGFKAESRKKDEKKDFLGAVIIYGLGSLFGFVGGGVLGVLWGYREGGGRRGPNIDAMLNDTDEAAKLRFLTGGVIGLVLVVGWVWKTFRSK